jgi:hypothetical protein
MNSVSNILSSIRISNNIPDAGNVDLQLDLLHIICSCLPTTDPARSFFLENIGLQDGYEEFKEESFEDQARSYLKSMNMLAYLDEKKLPVCFELTRIEISKDAVAHVFDSSERTSIWMDLNNTTLSFDIRVFPTFLMIVC